jgi:cytochrome c oxidase subunit 2
MPVVVEVLPADQFTAWLAERSPAAAAQPAVARTEAPAAPQGVAASMEPPATEAAWDLDSASALGRELHVRHCAACHQADGRGLQVAGFPALAGTQVSLDEHKQISGHGRQGTAMAAFGPQLDDQQLAAIVTYQRTAWGNDTGDLVEPADIAAVR